MFTFAGFLLLCISFTVGSRPSARYLPPNYAGTSSIGHSGYGRAAAVARPSNQYLAPQASNVQYQGVSGSGDHFGGSGRDGGTGHFGGGRAAVHAAAGHGRSGAQIPILRSDFTNDGQGNYNFGFETGNGIRRDETGNFEGGWPHGSLDVKGSYSYTGDDGRTYTVHYTADKNGFHAQGDHLPTPPPVPRQIQQSLALHQRSSHDGGYGGSHGAGIHGSGSHGGGSHGYTAYGNHAAGSDHIASSRYLPPNRRTRFARRHF